MFRIDSNGTVVALPTPAAAGVSSGYFTEGDPQTATPATVVSADWLNAVQEELVYAITQAGIALSKTDRTLLKQAIEKLASQGPVASKAYADSPYTMAAGTQQLAMSTAAGNCVVNLPQASTVNGKRFTVIKTTGDANTITLTPAGDELINGEATQVIDQQWTTLEVLSIGTGWVIV